MIVVSLSLLFSGPVCYATLKSSKTTDDSIQNQFTPDKSAHGGCALAWHYFYMEEIRGCSP
jgi:hypothetical protein